MFSGFPSEGFADYHAFDAAYQFAQKAGFQLTDLQIEDVNKFRTWKASLNLYEVGGGKTVVSSVVSLMRGVGLTVVVVPPILMTPWTRWLKQVSERVICYRGTPKERRALDVKGARWIVVSQAIFRQEAALFYSLRDMHHGNVELIIDEAQSIKNPGSVLYKKVKSFVVDAALQMLTGTPISKPLDAYSYISLKSPELYRSYLHFEQVHVLERDFWKVPKTFQNIDFLKQSLAIQSISRTKKELHGYNLTPLFPDSTYSLSPEHMALYKRLVEEQLLIFDDGTKIDASSAQALRHALQQIVVNFDYYSNEETNRSAAYDLIDQTIEETGCANLANSKLIIWTKYKRTSGSVLRYCNGLGIKTVAAYSGADTEKSIEAFMHDQNTRILVAQYQSAGAGLNPQLVCSEALFLELDVVPMYIRQAIGRLDRVGQTVPPRMQIAVAEGTVQVYLHDCLMRNDDMVSRIEPTKDGLRKMLLGQL